MALSKENEPTIRNSRLKEKDRKIVSHTLTKMNK